MIEARHSYINITSTSDENKNKDSNEIVEVEVEDRSPKAKKQKTNTKTNMKKLDEYKEMQRRSRELLNDVEQIKQIVWENQSNLAISHLVKKTENIHIRDLIKCFDVIGADKKYNNFEKSVENIKTCTQTWTEKENYIIEAINFVGEGENGDKLRTLNFDELVAYLVFIINTRMPKKCKECEEWYRNEMGTEPQMRCMLCNIGLHSCNKINENSKITGLVWMCCECLEKCERCDIIEDIRMRIVKETIWGKDINENNENTDNRKEKEVTKVRITEKRKREMMEMDRIEVVEVDVEVHSRKKHGDTANNIARENGEGFKSSQEKNDQDKKSKEQENGQRRVCAFWVKDRCKFEHGCKYAHPELCKTIMEKGKCQTECGRFHPKMCYAMNKNGFCNKGKRCYFTHFRDTKNSGTESNANSQRNRYESQHITNTYNSQPNHNQPWQHNGRNTNQYNNSNEYNEMSEPHMDFYMHQNTNWQAMRKPIMERAAEILAEKMMWYNQ